MTDTITDIRYMAEDYFLLLCDPVKFRVNLTTFWENPMTPPSV